MCYFIGRVSTSTSKQTMVLMSTEIWQRRSVKWLLGFAGWTLVGLFFSVQIYLIYNVLEGKVFPWWRAVLSTLPDWYLWALLSLLIVQIARRFPLDRESWPRHLPVHIAASLLVALLQLALAVAVLHFLTMRYSGSSRTWLDRFRFNFFVNYHWGVLTYWAIVGASHAFQYYRSLRERTLQTTQLAAQLAQAQLEALKMQLQPHFLFNTLQNISALLAEDVRAADKMIARLGDFLRLTLANSGAQLVTLQQELDFLKCYLEIEQVRFQDRLTTHFQIEPQTLLAQVPNLILQPIVENAIKHGLAPGSGTGRIEILACREQEWLRVQVRDNGAGLPVQAAANGDLQAGLGLANTRARLQQLYGQAHRFELNNAPEGGLVVTLEIPFSAELTA
jgi:two-component system, LytTR family, sensor kinase